MSWVNGDKLGRIEDILKIWFLYVYVLICIFFLYIKFYIKIRVIFCIKFIVKN